MKKYENGQKLVLVCSNCRHNFITEYGKSEDCPNCGQVSNLYPLEVEIILAPTLEEAKKVQSDITIEAEYGDETIIGTLYTSAHHVVNSDNPAPCVDEKIPYIEFGTILVSHIDLDMLLGCGRALGLITDQIKMELFCEVAANIDVDGPHHIHEYGENMKKLFDAYWAWNESRGRQERIEQTTDVTQKVLESIEIIFKIIDGNEELIEQGEKWVSNVQEEVEARLINETENYRVFSTDRVFCGSSYWSPRENKIISAIVSYNEKFKAITLSFEDGGEKYNAVDIMQKIFGSEAGGRAGIAGTPRGKEYQFEDTQKVIKELEEVTNG